MSRGLGVSEAEYDYELALEEELDESEALESFCPQFKSCVKVMVEMHLKTYFQGRAMYCGGPISTILLQDRKLVNMVANTSIKKGVRRAHRVMKKCCHCKPYRKGVDNQVQLVLKVLNDCAKLRIPNQFKGGMILAHLHFCVGCPGILD